MQAFVSLQLGPSEPPQISVVPAVLVDPTEELEPMGVLRLGHVNINVLALEEAVDHYVNGLGLIETGQC